MSFGELAGSQNIADSVNVRICHFLQSSLKIPSPTKNHGQNAVLHSIYAANQLLRAILAKRESGELLPHPLEFHQRVEHEPFFLPDPLCVCFFGELSPNHPKVIIWVLKQLWDYGWICACLGKYRLGWLKRKLSSTHGPLERWRLVLFSSACNGKKNALLEANRKK